MLSVGINVRYVPNADFVEAQKPDDQRMVSVTTGV